MADYIYYVNPGADAGGDGTADALTGGTCAYQTLNAAVTALAGNETGSGAGTSGDSITFRCSGTTGAFQDTTGVSLSGFTAGVSVIVEGYNGNYTGRQFDTGYDDSDCYALRISASNTNALTCADENITVRYLQVANLSASNFYDAIKHTNSSHVPLVIDSCRVNISKSNSTKVGYGIRFVGNGTTPTIVKNNIIYGQGQTSTSHAGLYVASATQTEIYNNTVYSCARGITLTNFDPSTIQNNVFAACNDDWGATSPSGTYSHNADSNDGDTPGTNNVVLSTTITDELTDPANNDFTVTSNGASNNIWDAGTSGGNIPTVDIDGTSRSNYSIGAYEYVSAGTTKQVVVAITSASTVTVATKATKRPVVAITSTSTVTVTARAIRRAQVAVASTSTTTIAVRRIRRVQVAIASASTTTVVTRATRRALVAIASASTVAVVSRATKRPLVAIVSASTVAVVTRAIRRAVVNIASTSTVTIVAKVAAATKQVAVAITSASAVAVVPRATRRPAVAITSSSTVTVATRATKRVAVAITSTSAVAVVAGVATGTKNVLVAITASSTVGVVARATRRAVVAIASVSTTIIAARAIRRAAVAIASASTVTIVAQKAAVTKQVTVAISATSTTTVVTRATKRVAVAISSVSTVTVNVVRTALIQVAINAVSTVTIAARNTTQLWVQTPSAFNTWIPITGISSTWTEV